MPRRRLPYREGTWFAVPLRSDGYAIGVAARIDGRGGILGYFFGPKRDALPREVEISRLSADAAVWIGQFGDLGLLKGEWPIICHSQDWDRGRWPMPRFARVDEHAGRAWLTTYSEDTLRALSEEPCDLATASQYPKDRLSGSGAVEITLTKLLT